MHDELELLAPAGNWECARAAVENGADAIYFGLESGFNARARAANFSLDDLPQLLEFLHLRGVRGYVTLNTLVFSDELEQFQEHAIAVARAGVDAVLVQDLGVAQLIRTTCPQLEIHASTQMSLSSNLGAGLAAELGLARVVLPRELSIDEIGQLDDSAVGLEAFVHGALCVAYSGQCLTSESLGGRSANRGQCAQACRLPYEVICDDEYVELGDVKYLLSPQDLAAHDLIPRMIEAGVRSFKIEGRLKTPEYVANVTRRYRAALDAAMAGRSWRLDPQAQEELELSFSRGFSPGWLEGCDHKMLVPGLSSAKRGVYVGEVTAVKGRSVIVTTERELRPGDGVVFDGDRAANLEQGGRILAVNAAEKKDAIRVTLQFRREDITVDDLWVGQKLWKTDDPRLTKRLRRSFVAADPIRRVWLDLKVVAHAGQPLRIDAVAENGASFSYVGSEPLPVARKHPASDDKVRKELGRLGGTVYQLRQIDAQFVESPMIPLSIFGKARRAIVGGLKKSLQPPSPTINSDALGQLRRELPPAKPCELSLHVLCRKLWQVEPVLELGVKSVYVDFQDIREYREAVEIVRDADARICLATPRIEKPGELGVFRAMEKHEADGVLVRNLGGLSYFRDRGIPCVADFSLNAANELTVGVLKGWGAERVTASYDLNRDQILDLVRQMEAGHLEVVIHQHMPMFHMEHCVFCAVLSPGTNKTNCGRPCDFHVVRLRDRVGMEHPLHADVGCRNTLYNATPQSSAEIGSVLIQHGVRNFRVELLENTPAETKEVVGTYQQLLDGDISGAEVWRRLKASNQVGVTRGTLEEKRNPLSII